MRKHFLLLALLLVAALAGCNSDNSGCLFCGPDPEPEPTPLEIIDDFLPVNEQNESKKGLACLVNGQPLMTYQTSNKEYARAHAYPPEEEHESIPANLRIFCSARDWIEDSESEQRISFYFWTYDYVFPTDEYYYFRNVDSLGGRDDPAPGEGFFYLNKAYGLRDYQLIGNPNQNYVRFFRNDMKPPYDGPTIDDLYPIANGVFQATLVSKSTGDTVRITDGRFNLHIR